MQLVAGTDVDGLHLDQEEITYNPLESLKTPL